MFLIDTGVGSFYLKPNSSVGFYMTELYFSHPDRPTAKMQPLKAWRHFRKLIANKEDTAIEQFERIKMAYEQMPNFVKPGIKSTKLKL